MRKAVFLTLLLAVAAATATIAPQTAAAAACKQTSFTGNGSATSEEKARRNARLALISKIENRYPGNSASPMLGPIGYKCKNPLLWLCEATVTLCK
jgi:hypothetical protein